MAQDSSQKSTIKQSNSPARNYAGSDRHLAKDSSVARGTVTDGTGETISLQGDVRQKNGIKKHGMQNSSVAKGGRAAVSRSSAARQNTKSSGRSSSINDQKQRGDGREDDGALSIKSMSLAPVQRETLEFLRRFISERGYAPTLKDIATFIGVRSPSTAHFHLSRLEDKGFIRRSEDGLFELVEQGQPAINHSPFAVPLLGLIAAGAPIEPIEDTTVTVDIPPQFLDSRHDVYCLQVTGDSMIDAHIADGDIIIVRRQDTADNGQIVVAVLDNGHATLKTFRRLKGGKVMLLPHNPAHKPITADNVEIRGRMIGLIREL